MAQFPSASDVNVQLSMLRATGKDPLDSDLYLANGRDVLAQQLAATGQLATSVVNGSSEKDADSVNAQGGFAPHSALVPDASPSGAATANQWQPNLAATGDNSAPIFAASSADTAPNGSQSSLSSDTARTSQTSSNQASQNNTSQTATSSNGSNGTNGTNSQSTRTETATATNGTDGSNGTNGKDGTNGTNGTDGANCNSGCDDHGGHGGGGDTTIIQNYHYSSETTNTTNNFSSSSTTNNVNSTTTNNHYTENHTVHQTIIQDDHSQHFLSGNTILSGNSLHVDGLLTPVTVLVDNTVSTLIGGTGIDQSLGSLIGSLTNQTTTITTGITDPLSGLLGNTVNQISTHLDNTLGNVIGHTDNLTNIIDTTLNSVTNILNGDSLPTDHLPTIIDTTLTLVGDTLGTIGDTLNTTVGNILNGGGLPTDGLPVLGDLLGSNPLEPITDTLGDVVGGTTQLGEGLGQLIDALLPGEGALATLNLGGTADHTSGSIIDLNLGSHTDYSGTPLIDITGLSGNDGAQGSLVNLDLLNGSSGAGNGVIDLGLANQGSDHTLDLSLNLPTGNGETTPLLDIGLLGNDDGSLISIGVLDIPTITIPTESLNLGGAVDNLQSFLSDAQHGSQDVAASLFASGSIIDLGGSHSALPTGNLSLGDITHDITTTSQAVLSGADALGDALLGQGVGSTVGNLLSNVTETAHLPSPTVDPAAAVGHALGGLLPHWL